jgi:hypothetical protein
MKIFSKTLQVLVLALMPAVCLAGNSPIKGGGNFGIGLEFGDPGTWGAVGKFWIDENNAFQPAVKLGAGAAILQMDYLWHTYDLFHPNQGRIPLYFGVGGDLVIQNIVAFGVRGPVGISYMFDRVDVPVDIFVQVAPTLWIFDGATNFYVYGEVGARYYF